MKDLLTAVQARLIEQLAGVRPANIFISVDVQFIPPALSFPAVGIKDGDSQILTTEDGEPYGTVNRLEIAVYAQVLKPMDSIMGDKGVLSLAQAVTDALHGYDLGLGYWRAILTGCAASELFGDERRMAQIKSLYFAYTK